MKGSSSLHQIAELFRFVFKDRENRPSPIELETWSLVVGEVMSARWRYYHVPGHIFSLCSGTRDPLEILAILFHDLVYLQVDRRIHPKLQKYLYDFTPSDQYELVLHSAVGEKEYSVLPLVFSVFGVKPTQVIGLSTGINEVLSSIAAARILKPYLTTWELAQVIGCIEATIPFRGTNSETTVVPSRLHDALARINQEYNLGQSGNSIDNAVAHSVRVSNLDVRGFWSKDPSHFLFDTWNLILEGNPVFKNPYYTIGQYLAALEKVAGFYAHLDPASIPRTYLGEPSPAAFNRFIDDARKNIETGKAYLRIKILTTNLLLSIARLTGGDAPMILFLGEIKSFPEMPSQLEQYLDPRLKEISADWIDPEIHRLLTVGRSGPSGFDLRNSPLAAYLHARLDPKAYEAALTSQKAVSRGKANDLDFLASFPLDLAQAVLDAVARVAVTRTEALRSLKDSLFQVHKGRKLLAAS